MTGSERGTRRAFVLVVSTLVGLHACMAATRVAATLAVLEQGFPEWTVGALLSLYGLAPIVLSLWAGRMADRHGFHRPVALSVIGGLLGAALPILTQHIAALAISGLLTGGAVAFAAVAIQREAGQMARDPGDLKRVFSWVALGPALSNAFAPVVAGLLIDHVGYRAAFAFGALLPLLAAWAAWRVPRAAPAQAAGAASAAAQGSVIELWRAPVLRNLLLVNVAMAASWDAHSFTVPVVGHARELSASAIGLVLGSFAVAATVIRLVITGFAHRIDEQRALSAAIGVATVALLAYAWLPGALGMMAGSAVLGLALGSVQPMVLSMLHQAAPPGRQGQALALRMLFTNAATIAMPIGFGLLAAATTSAAPMWFMAAVLLAARVPVRRLVRR
ncbi:MAG TPA: MFS transporter [Burkholderiaceae bacterium]|nr:MFS transporter [Burkholderiaceae bacterium]